MNVCIAIPMYNEEEIAENSIRTILEYVQKLPVSAKLLVINDGSSDDTGVIAGEIESELNDSEQLHVVHHSKNQGYGAGQRTAIHYASLNNYDYIVFMDCDLTDHPKYLQEFVSRMMEGWDYIKTTRFAEGGGYQGVPWKRRIIARCGNSFARLVTGLPLTDITNGFRAAKVEVLKDMDLQENHFSIIIEELMKAKRVTSSFCEIPRVQGTRGDNAKPSSFSYDFVTYRKYLKYLFT